MVGQLLIGNLFQLPLRWRALVGPLDTVALVIPQAGQDLPGKVGRRGLIWPLYIGRR